MNIAIDMMGGDFAPLEAVKALKLYLDENKEPSTIFCVGKEAEINELLAAENLNHPSLQIINAPEVIGYNEHPTKALKEKQQSSIAIGFHLLATGKAGAFISAGNTGAMLVGAMHIIKPLPGVTRPTIATVMPKIDGGMGLIADVGLNADCKPENLNQFAVLGSLYAQYILNIDEPKVALVNVGEEEGKGNILAQAAYSLLKENSRINFVGNIEGRDFFNDKADVMVCEGFTGNVVLKMAEAVYEIAKQRNLNNDEYLSRFDYENYGGTPVLGIHKPVIIGHGISNALAFRNMILLAERMIETNVCGEMAKKFAE